MQETTSTTALPVGFNLTSWFSYRLPIMFCLKTRSRYWNVALDLLSTMQSKVTPVFDWRDIRFSGHLEQSKTSHALC
jgi:hypothetical protein